MTSKAKCKKCGGAVEIKRVMNEDGTPSPEYYCECTACGARTEPFDPNIFVEAFYTKPGEWVLDDVVVSPDDLNEWRRKYGKG